MPDPEMYKLILNGGSFGVMVIFVLWVLFKAAPILNTMLRELSDDYATTIEKLSARHEAAVSVLSAKHEATVGSLNLAHEQAMQSVVSAFQETLAAQREQCRAEFDTLLKRCDDASERDRQYRHDQATRFQEMMLEMQKKYLNHNGDT